MGSKTPSFWHIVFGLIFGGFLVDFGFKMAGVLPGKSDLEAFSTPKWIPKAVWTPLEAVLGTFWKPFEYFFGQFKKQKKRCSNFLSKLCICDSTSTLRLRKDSAQMNFAVRLRCRRNGVIHEFKSNFQSPIRFSRQDSAKRAAARYPKGINRAAALAPSKPY